MHRSHVMSAGVSIGILLTGACSGIGSRLPTATDLQMEKMERTRNTPPVHLAEMVDNAALQDMSIADFHFVGHTGELSGTGAARLSRMSPLLSTYGGTIHYETDLKDDKLMQQRMEHVREYLATTGCDMSRVEVKPGLSTGAGMSAQRAIAIDAKGTSKPEKGTASATAVSSMAPSGKSGN